MLLAGGMTDVVAVVISMTRRGGASLLKLERTEGSPWSANIVIMWLACFCHLANNCPIRIGIMHGRWRTVILLNSPRRWLMFCSICLFFFVNLNYCKRPTAILKGMPGKEMWHSVCFHKNLQFWIVSESKLFHSHADIAADLVWKVKFTSTPIRSPLWWRPFSTSIFLLFHSQWVSPVFLWLIKVYCRRSRSGLRALMKRDD